MTGAFIPSGYNNVFFSKPRSMARFGLLMLNQGNWNGNQILTDTNYFQQMVNSSQTLNPSYGYLTWLNGKSSFKVPGLQFNFPGSFSPNAPNDMIAALGKDGQIINIVPSQNLVYIRMGNAPGAGEVPITFNDTVWIKLNAVMCNTTSLSSLNPEASFTVSPNPFHDVVTIQNKTQDRVEVILMDVTGKRMFSKFFSDADFKLNLSTFSNGMYLMKVISNEGKSLVKRIVKN
jgi:CubicO group peptidase (beta-lactamase class C family)